ncbi:MAG TPA: gamma-glutamyl-gamma-aminobutyrate hydrolase family protein [Myxococcales bacterium]|nr:gamma-glutamyl-gamma-aminobutyrate hydrolase family protein [Myxococcales bacterium]
MRPVIGITPDVGESTPRPGRPALPRYELKQAYADAVLAAGGLPIVLPCSDDPSAPEEALKLCDGLVITGGAFDVPPEAYGAKAGRRLGPLKRGRTAYEQRVLRAALAGGIPVLGICGGMQLLAVELGGTLYQDIASEVPGALDHEQKNDPREPGHTASVVGGSALEAIVGPGFLEVNSTHHQAVKDPGRAKVCAVAPDGIVEAIELPGTFALGVEWHPELLAAPAHLALYRALVERARR